MRAWHARSQHNLIVGLGRLRPGVGAV